MDIDISKMFRDKNKEILTNSLTLEMERNLETLKNTTDNCVSLEINKLFLFFKKYFEEIGIEIKKEDILGVLYREKKEINDIVNSEIDKKKNNIKDEFFSRETEEVLTEDYLKDYCEFLKNETERINNEIDIQLSKEITTNFSPEIIKKYKLEKEEYAERIHSRIDILFKDNIISRVKDQISFRDESLKNMMNESYKKYLELNKSTVDKNIEN